MLVIKIELHSAVTGEVSELSRMHIVNDGTGDASVGNYEVAILPPKGTRIISQSRVEGYPRLQYTVWELVRRALGGRGSTPFTPVDQSPRAPR